MAIVIEVLTGYWEKDLKNEYSTHQFKLLIFSDYNSHKKQLRFTLKP